MQEASALPLLGSGGVARSFLFPRLLCYRRAVSTGSYTSTAMNGEVSLLSEGRKKATSRLCNVSGFTTELLEIHSEDPSLHILLFPGNPGVIAFYKDFVEAVYGLLRGNASVTAIGHISHTRKNWEGGRLFSLQDQVEHKVDFIKQNFQKKETPLILVGHSIGAYIALETYKRFQHQVTYTVGLYPFLAMNRKSLVQSLLLKITRSSLLIATVSSLVAILGLLPVWATRFLVRIFIGQSWSAGTIEAASSHLPHYNIMWNILYMARTEFKKLSEGPDWTFIKEKQNQLAFLFGTNDHWGPMTLLEEISKRASDASLTIEREDHTHGFCCTESGSYWVAHYVATLVKDKFSIVLR